MPRHLLVALAIAAALVLGGGLAPVHAHPTKHLHVAKKSARKVVYTCAMHPEVRSDKPGKCPKCGMDLVRKTP